MDIDFTTGRLDDVARRERADRRREFLVLGLILSIASLPYALLFCWRPWLAIWAILSAAFFKVVQTFLVSTQTETSHHIRFLLAGGNPFAMTGGMSLLLGGVDSLFDWKEDRKSRRQGWAFYWLTTIAKFLATPLGVVLTIFEFLWDTVLLRRGWRLVRWKLREFFSVAYFHDLVCPEKSNDIFYADLAMARYNNDPYLYQWQRLRAMVFELEHYRLDVQQGQGDPATNVLLQDEMTGYQTIRRLQLESLENVVAAHYAVHPDAFPLPSELSQKLIQNARPVEHYLRLRSNLFSRVEPKRRLEIELRELLYGRVGSGSVYFTWHVLRLLEDWPAFPDDCSYLNESIKEAMRGAGILAADEGGEHRVQFTQEFLTGWESFLKKHFVAIDVDKCRERLLVRQPFVVCFGSVFFEPQIIFDEAARCG